MSDDMSFAEGCYRLNGGQWQVVTAIKHRDHQTVGVRDGVRWKSGVTGINIVLPDEAKLNAAILLEIMSKQMNVTEWHEVKGPDSMALR